MIDNIIYSMTAPYTFQKSQTSLPEPESDFVTVKYLYCGICGSDYSKYIGRRKKYPTSLGHEFIARVVALGANVEELAVNDLVVSDFNYRCNDCSFCKEHKSHLCVNNGIGKFSNRAFSNYANIHKHYLYKVPSFSYLPTACLVEPFSCVLHACESMKLTPKLSILINGCGSIGMLFSFYLKKILNYDNIKMLEVNEQRSKKIQKYFSILPYEQDDIFDLIIECSNSVDGLHHALQLSLCGKTICIMSHLYGADTSFVYEIVCKKELNSIYPLRNGEPQNVRRAISYLYSFWKNDYNDMLGLYDNPIDAFAYKEQDGFNKQIIICN